MAEALSNLIEVEVAYALPQTQTVVTLTVAAGTTVKDAIVQSGLAAQHPEVDWDAVTVGIFGERVSVSTVLNDHDRVEIYRPLIADPKQARHNRASGRNAKRR
jgi:putative ubiquitin-RnfH superfamily antitoxin RatB of RatAB toxin-antitoxin module